MRSCITSASCCTRWPMTSVSSCGALGSADTSTSTHAITHTPTTEGGFAMTQTATAPAGRRINRSTLYFFGALGGILFGYDLGIIAAILVIIAKDWHLSGFQKGVVTASLSIGAMIGAAAASRLGDRLGRRRAIMAAALVVIAGTVAC